MLLSKLNVCSVLSCLLLASASFAQPQYIENKGQWHDDVFFRAETKGGYAFLDKEGITLLHLESGFFTHLHDWIQGTGQKSSGNAHAVKMKFVDGNLESPSTRGDAGYANNYFIGDDASKWATDVRSYNRVDFRDVYPGIHVRHGSSKNQLKYDFIVSPGADHRLIKIDVQGANSLRIKDHELVIETEVGSFKELKPFAYQLDESDNIVPVPCEFQLDDSMVTYHFPDGYDQSKELIIDPEIAFSTYIGSNSSNFGFTASYDDEGNLYAGAIVFGIFYPTTTGVVQFNFSGGTIDCGISKFNDDGTDLVYNTFLGGTGNEAPHSIVVSELNELYILGSTSSFNFPTSANGFQTNFAGGTTTAGAGYSYDAGSDIFVTKLSAEADDILGSTYVGGNGNDGVGTDTELDFNYGDRFRGEIVVDESGNAFVASTSASPTFPIVNGYAGAFNGSSSGVIFKLNSDLSEMEWSTFSGGSNTESAISLQLANDNTVYFTGGTTSPDLGVSADAYQGTFGGTVDGYIGHISADGTQLLHCTYNGTPQFDQNYFVQIDTEGDIYVVGQSLGDYEINGNVYSIPNSGQFIQKFDAELANSEWSTVIGSGNGGIDISPSAFLVTNCGQVYVSGWGGSVNYAGGNTNGLPITPDAFQADTDGNDFYLMVLDEEAEDLVYATFFGGGFSGEHVDGGTSRFDKDGTVYQAVCAGCGGNSDFPTQPGVWSQTNEAMNCNLGVFKFRLSSTSAIAEIDGPDVICPEDEFELLNLSSGSNTYFWDFGDGNTSAEEEPTYSYSEPGEYEIKLVSSDSEGCLAPDSTFITVTVEDVPNIEIGGEPFICSGETVQLEATGADDWEWFPADDLSASDVSNPVFTGDATTELNVVGFTTCGSDTIQLEVVVGGLNISSSEDSEICPGESVALNAGGGSEYLWSPAEGLSATDIPNPQASPAVSTTYSVEITTEEGCSAVEEVQVDVLPPPPQLSGNENYVSCNGAPVQLSVSGAETYMWSPADGLSSASANNPTATPLSTTVYTVTGENSCGSAELEVTVQVGEISVSIAADSVVCFDNLFTLEAFGADAYVWQPDGSVLDKYSQTTRAIIETPTIFSVTGIDSLGCTASDSRLIQLFPRAGFRAGNDRVINFGDEITLETFSPFPITWEENPYLSCTYCNFPEVNPPETTTFYASVTTEYDCIESDSVTVFVRGQIYVPNAFTPDGDGLNDIFKARGVDIATFNMKIFNRWGDLVFESNNIDEGWNGGTRNSDYYCPPDMYQYIIVAQEEQGEVFELSGHVVLIR